MKLMSFDVTLMRELQYPEFGAAYLQDALEDEVLSIGV